MTWFNNWFESPYWAILYRNRNDEEARSFLTRLTGVLKLQPGASICDAGCGKGRHSHFLAAQGYQVTGLDISSHNIAAARENSGSNETFFVHDMLEPFPVSAQDCVMNLFTSFGYFSDEAKNARLLRNMASAVRSGGCLVVDYLNAAEVRRKEMGHQNFTSAEGIKFDIEKVLEKDSVKKRITVTTPEGEVSNFDEMVMLYELRDFERMLKGTDMKLIHLFGNYMLDPLNDTNSDRLIMVFEKA